ncbi:ABC transporter permease [Thermaerobacter sp. PB12/4term]|uniref:ABC transporter permease n=1 Tax=Thermaerobacter sp. PB12/4term TaxID=2293838 RepID=UPI000E32C291|nr:ABC transporter permease [Thermaerobacter sp. PB12/4term]QIA27893.1 ABC transporter permease [Thermaerobacter sp. PB12/4term]
MTLDAGNRHRGATLRRVAAIAVTTTRRTLLRPLNLLWLLIVPLFFGGVVASLFAPSDKPPRLAVVVEDQGPWVGPLLDGLSATPMNLQRLARDEAAARLHQGRERVVLLIPDGFSRSVEAGVPRLELWYAPRAEPGEEMARIRAVAAGLVTGTPAGPLSLVVEAPRPAAAAGDFALLRTVYGFYVMFSLVSLITQAAALHRERDLGTLSRSLVAGATYGEMVAGHALALFLLGLLQAAAMVGVTALGGAPWFAAGLPALVLALVAPLVAACGIALAVAGFTRTSRQINAAGSLVGTIAAMLGGAFWPLDVVPVSLQEVARLSPVYWALDGLREAFVFGGPGAAQWPAVATLVLMGVLAGTAGVLGLRRWAA